MDHSPTGSPVHGILQARITGVGAMPSSRGSSQPRERTCVSYISCIGRQVLYHSHHLGSPDGGIRSDQIRSAAQLCPTLWDPMNRSTPCPSPTPGVHWDGGIGASNSCLHWPFYCISWILCVQNNFISDSKCFSPCSGSPLSAWGEVSYRFYCLSSHFEWPKMSHDSNLSV